MRRRGYPPAALRDFVSRTGVTKKEHLIQMSLLENCVREDLNVNSARAMAVINPLKVVLTNYPAEQVEMLPAANHPDRPELGERQLPFGRELWIEQDDFMENAPNKFFRLKPGGEVRLRYGYIIKCVDLRKDAEGRVTEVHCTYDPETRSGLSGAERKVKGTIHWVSAAHAVRAEVRLYDRLFGVARPDGGDADFKTFLNAESLRIETHACLERSLASAGPGTVLQFERLGYFVADRVDFRPSRPVFNRVVTLRDSWAKIEAIGDMP
jgi:glutaminyl-tRNA synthetase